MKMKRKKPINENYMNAPNAAEKKANEANRKYIDRFICINYNRLMQKFAAIDDHVDSSAYSALDKLNETILSLYTDPDLCFTDWEQANRYMTSKFTEKSIRITMKKPMSNDENTIEIDAHCSSDMRSELLRDISITNPLLRFDMNDFKTAIKQYLDDRAANDELFAKAYTKANKSLDECCKYIIGKAAKKAKGNCAALTDDMVFGWAVHYYDEDEIKINDVHGMRTTVSAPPSTPAAPAKKIKLTDAEIKEAKKAALDAEMEKQRRLLYKKPAKAKKVEPEVLPSLFD